MPPIVLTIVAVIQAAIKYAPTAIDLFKKIKEQVSVLFAKKAITKEQQDALHAWVDAIVLTAEKGEIPLSWQVDPDPVSP